MRTLIALMTGAMTLLSFDTVIAAQESQVELTRVGVSTNSAANCLPGSGQVNANRVVTIEIDARRKTPGISILGSMRLVNALVGFELADGNDQRVVFRRDHPSSPSRFRLRIPARDNVQAYVQFVAVDNAGVASEIRGCELIVVQPSFSVRSLRVGSPDDRGARRITATIRNTQNAELINVPWSIWMRTRASLAGSSTQTLRTGVIPSIPALGSFEISAPLNARSAAAVVGASVDAANTLAEPPPARSDNHASISVVPVSVLELDPAMAATAGATFPHNITGDSICSRLGVGNWRDTSWDGWAETPRATGVLFVADCSPPPFPVLLPPTGGKADPEAYKGFLLKNGWTIRSAEVTDVYSNGGTFRWVIAPMVGTNDPHIQMHLAADMFQIIKRGVRIVIEGPAGTSPYF